MNLQFGKPHAFLSIFVLLFCFFAANAQKTENQLSVADQREIIAVLLNEKFKRSAEKTIYVSTANLPEEIRKDFPTVKNKTIRLVASEKASDSEICAYEFGEFQFIEKFVSVSFGNCREGLAYDFVKDGENWKTASLIVTRELFY